MGVLINEVCCIDSSYIAESENDYYHQGQFIESSGKNIYKNLENNKFYHSSFLKPLPLNEIKYNAPKNPFQNEVKSLTQIPISNENVIRKQSGNPLDYYEIIKKLGKGTFGTVYKVMHKKTGIVRAMKVIPKNNLKCGFTDEDIIQEINILKKLEHPHIIKLYEFYTFKKNYYLINEFCTDGDLSEKLSKLRMFPEFIVKILMIQVFNAVMYLNENCVIHGDLKLENIMIDSFLKKDEINNTRGNKINFIQSLLEDEKEINEYLRQNELKRSSTFHNFLNKKSNFLNKIKEKNMKIINKEYMKDKLESPDEEITTRKRGRTIKSSLFKKNNGKKDDKINEKKEEITKSAFAYLNGEEIDEETEEDKNKENGIIIDSSIINIDNSSVNKNDSNINIGNSSNNNIIVGYRSNEEIENGIKKMNNIKVYNENFIKNQSEVKKIIKENKKYLQKKMKEQKHKKLQSEELNNSLKKVLTLNSMKMKNFELKLIDFGCAKIFSKYKKNFKDTIGTLIYCSPEVLKNNYSKQCDIWSCGVIMYVLLSGHFPFFGKTEEEIKKKILSGKFIFNKKYFSHVSEKAKDLIKKCLIYDKNKRITAEEAVKHEFFADDINPNNIFEDKIDSKHVLISLKNYSQQSKIYQAVLAFLSHNFADKIELNKLKKIFYKIDLNLDGKLSKDELYKAYKEAGMEMEYEQLNKVIESIDFDGNGFIEYEEFIRVTLSKDKLFTEKNLKYAFDMFDLDKNGTISLNEFKEILGIKKIKDKNVNKELLKEIPIHGNEEINFEQFKKILNG